MYMVHDDKIEFFDRRLPIDVKYTRLQCPVGMQSIEAQNNVIVSLDADLDIIKKSFSGKFRQYLNKCEKEDEPISNFIFSPTDKDLDEFNLYFKRFADDKNSDVMRGVLNNICEYNSQMAKNKIFCISSIYSRKNPEIKIFHTHTFFAEEKYVRMVSTISEFRHLSDVEKQMVGRLNRYLHWLDFKKFKELGYVIYDLGGVTLGNGPEENEKIAQFKFSISNKIKKYYYATSSSFISNNAVINKQRKKTISIVYEQEAEYDRALKIVNQLSDMYCFVLEKNTNLLRVDFVHDLRFNSDEKMSVLFDVEEFFVKHNRGGNLAVGDFSEISKKTTNVSDLCEQLNLYDVVICEFDNDIIRALACGCFVICKQSTLTNKIIKNKCNGIVVGNDILMEEAIDFCKKNIQTIRNNSLNNAKCITEQFAYYANYEYLVAFYEKQLKSVWLKLHNHFVTFKELFKTIRRFFFQFHIKKHKKVVRILGFYLINKQKK